MNLKVFILLLAVLSINALRYGSYLLEGSTNNYNWVLFVLNLFSLIIIVIVKIRTKSIDRKSTRLNSSHVSISYAVFCLKKKKKNLHNDKMRIKQEKHIHKRAYIL